MEIFFVDQFTYLQKKKRPVAFSVSALCPVKYTDQIDKNFRRLDCGIFPRSSRFCLCRRVWY
ncbi:hypothetical protein DT304_13565 [Lactobacillus reuteri]|nr:hypothetical protein [Limosilactobacillus reuteri]MBC6912171.1 hypothetical protein [Limosilactobacillus reuteri]